MYLFVLYDNKAECWERCFSSCHESGTKKKLIKLYGETIQMKAIEQFFSSCVSVYQAVHRGFNLNSLDKTLVCNHVNEDIKAHALSLGNFSLVYRKTYIKPL